jgi:hypothetical protein
MAIRDDVAIRAVNESAAFDVVNQAKTVRIAVYPEPHRYLVVDGYQDHGGLQLHGPFLGWIQTRCAQNRLSDEGRAEREQGNAFHDQLLNTGKPYLLEKLLFWRTIVARGKI